MAGNGDISIKALGLTLDELTSAFGGMYDKGRYHAEALFRRIYLAGDADVAGLPEYGPAPELASRVARDWAVNLPVVGLSSADGGTRKYTLGFAGGAAVESVLIPMSEWNTLCISSQVGCRRGCAFCETARMGLVRDLDTAEIVAQWAHARFRMGVAPRNIVYMGMGEPFDNFENVIRSIRILSDPRGAGIPKRRISVSTSGHVDGIRALAALEAGHPEEAWRTVHLAVSLNAPNDRIRSELMPINRKWNMAALKAALKESIQSEIKDSLYFEYVVIPGVNSEECHARELADWLGELKAKVNIIPYHPRNNSPWEAPDDETMDRFHRLLLSSGVECRTRRSRGKGIEAACGMLGRKKGC